MVLLGVIVNAAAIIIGTLLGLLFTRINPQLKESIMHVIGLAVIVLGLDMAFTSANFLLVLFSLIAGAIIGEMCKLEVRLDQLGKWVENKVGKDRGNVSRAFVTTTLLYCVGAMAVVGALNSGLRLDHNVLYTKSILDGFTAIIFASTLGIGVFFSAIPVFLYQGGLALAATQISQWFSFDVINQIVDDLTSTGGILIMAIGFNLLGLTNIKVGNLLPAILVAVVLSALFIYFPI